MRTGKGSLFRAYYIAKESTTTIYFDKNPKAGREVGNLYSGEKGKVSCMPCLEAFGMGTLKAS